MGTKSGEEIYADSKSEEEIRKKCTNKKLFLKTSKQLF